MSNAINAILNFFIIDVLFIIILSLPIYYSSIIDELLDIKVSNTFAVLLIV